ncbi:hypothetical protein [Blastococcus deserti]|uniref:Uncharacterized protein n=1 Tax=Blastococcus deserti TaxID=2259033 RepID=A0ABW4X8S8_9ACTN
MPSLTSLVGAATAAGSAALVVAPRIFLGPARLADTADTRALVRAMGARDTGIGLAMMAAPSGRARRLATAARVLSDWTDVATLPPALAGRGAAGRVVGFASAWGALSLAALLADERAGR